MVSHVVVVPLVIAKSIEGTDVYLYEGAEVPQLRKGEIKRLSDNELIQSVEQVVLPTDEEIAAQQADADRVAAEQAKADEAKAKRTTPKQ